MNIMKIANTTSPWSLEAFAQAVIEEYKASLVPVAVYKNESITATYGVKWLVQTPLKNDTKLYTLGETKC